MCQESRRSLADSSTSGPFMRLQSRWQPELGSYLKARLQEDSFPSSFSLLAQFSSSTAVWLRVSFGLLCQHWVMCPYLHREGIWENKCEYLEFLPLAGCRSLPARKDKQGAGIGDSVEEAIRVHHRQQLLRDRLFQGYMSILTRVISWLNSLPLFSVLLAWDSLM